MIILNKANKMKYKRFAAIDIGSNAVRMLISNVNEKSRVNKFRKETLVRVPIRLGQDVFTKHKISKHNTSL